jgi:diguanylate cyclase (GGDEF)-like protein
MSRASRDETQARPIDQKSTRARQASRARAVAATSRTVTRLSRAHLEEAFARLTEENERLRDELVATSSLWQIAHQDPLTELWNRRYADQRLAQEMSRAKRETGYRFSMVVVDVDNLKHINDHAGHRAGDRALQWVARFLNQDLRGHDLCCRLGGDEFLLVLPGSGEKECRDFVERLHRRWKAAAEEDRNAVPVSIGCASFPSQGSTVAVLLSIADHAMYANKRRGGIARSSSRAHDEGRTPHPEGQEARKTTAPIDTGPGNPRARLVSC